MFFIGVQNVIGALDCMHVALLALPDDDAPAYVNRKGYHSINVQVRK